MNTSSAARRPRTLGGKCLCGEVQYAVADTFLYAQNCHCSNCRRATGSAFKPFAGVERSKLRPTEGTGSLSIFGKEDAHDAHCKACGSLLYSVMTIREQLLIKFHAVATSTLRLDEESASAFASHVANAKYGINVTGQLCIAANALKSETLALMLERWFRLLPEYEPPRRVLEHRSSSLTLCPVQTLVLTT